MGHGGFSGRTGRPASVGLEMVRVAGRHSEYKTLRHRLGRLHPGKGNSELERMCLVEMGMFEAVAAVDEEAARFRVQSVPHHQVLPASVVGSASGGGVGVGGGSSGVGGGGGSGVLVGVRSCSAETYSALRVAARGRRSSADARLEWVAAHLDSVVLSDFDLRDVPSPGAVNFLSWCQASESNRASFFGKYASYTKRQSSAEAKYDDDGRELDRLLQVLSGRAASVGVSSEYGGVSGGGGEGGDGWRMDSASAAAVRVAGGVVHEGGYVASSAVRHGCVAIGGDDPAGGDAGVWPGPEEPPADDPVADAESSSPEAEAGPEAVAATDDEEWAEDDAGAALDAAVWEAEEAALEEVLDNIAATGFDGLGTLAL